MNNNNSRKNRKRNMRRKGKSNKTLPSSGNIVVRDNPRFPNDVKMLPIHNRVIRYINASAATNSAITPGNILRSVGMVTSGTTAFVPIFGCIRLRRVSLYSVPSTGDFGTSASEISFIWTGVQNAPTNLITDRGTAFMPACIKIKPPFGTIAAMWFDANSATLASSLFVVSAPANTIMDIEFDFILANGASPSSLTLTGTSSFTGIAFVLLDPPGADWTPDGVTSFTPT